MFDQTPVPASPSSASPASQQPEPISPDGSLPTSSAAAPAKRARILLAVVALLLLVGGALAYTMMGNKGKATITETAQPTAAPLENSPSPNASADPSPLFTGQLTRLNEDLQLFTFTESDKENGLESIVAYYQAGTFRRGDLAGYTRIIAVRQPEGPGSLLTFVLATKDFKDYILDDPENKTTKLPADDWENPFMFLDKSKISRTAVFETEHAQTINLDQNFALFRQDFPTQHTSSSQVNADGNTHYTIGLDEKVSTYKKLSSPINNLTFYFKPFSQVGVKSDQLNQAEKAAFTLKQKYFLGSTEVLVTDSSGLSITYNMSTPSSISQYLQERAQFVADWNKYLAELERFNKDEIAEMPRSPEYVHAPSLGFSGSEITNQTGLKFYSEYELAFPNTCAMTHNSRVLSVTDSELEPIGSVADIPVFRLKDPNHPLNQLAYTNKMMQYDAEPTAWEAMNPGTPRPTLEEYVGKNPLLFVKNYWQQWVALGEYEIMLPGGCGKPVVYLYPEKPTAVTVRFDAPMQLTTQIPTYADFWHVTAYPNGNLVNLKPEFTNCEQLDTHKTGSEYAKEACQKNVYPYLYWAGNVVSQEYPHITQGWIVARDDVQGFLQNKLTEVGLNSHERADFLEYWAPELLAKNAPYYRVSFLQTSELNSLFPMTVTPHPDTVFRLFLDYTPLDHKPATNPEPQQLDHLVRRGFTLVEWGGLKQK